MMDDIINHKPIVNTTTAESRVRRVRHEPRRREVEVARVLPLGPHFVAITFSGESLADFVSESFDDHVKLILPAGEGEPVRRDYTPRRFDHSSVELTIEFALHGHGHASEWARHAQAGDRAVIGGPRGSMIVSMDCEWHLLVGDATALPAIHRRLEELPAQARVIVVLQLEDDADRRRFDTGVQAEVHWARTTDELIAIVSRLPLPPGEGYAWAAGEASAMAQVRTLWLEKGQPREAMRVSAYWKQGASDFHDTLKT